MANHSMIRYEVADSIATITFDRVKSLNAMTEVGYAEMRDCLRSAQADPHVHVVVITGAGRSFCAGSDVEEFLNYADIDPEEFANPANSAAVDIVFALMELEKPLIASVNGIAVGFGATLLLHCDLVFIATTASVTFPFTDLGVVPELGSTQLLANAVGSQHAARILLGSETLTATEMLGLGLAVEITESDELLARVMQQARTLAGKSLGSIMASKRLLKRNAEPLPNRVLQEFRILAERLRTDEVQSGFRVFVKQKNARKENGGGAD
ncbi:MAG: enoyl-CoA hydratase-related protein [Woeseiaceae bacterium]|nr:enoyl-CoA hydratase-related protein [Woeseiaceae bacterium]